MYLVCIYSQIINSITYVGSKSCDIAGNSALTYPQGHIICAVVDKHDRHNYIHHLRAYVYSASNHEPCVRSSDISYECCSK